MKAIIVCTSVSHGNTRRVADVIGRVLDARVVDPDEIDPRDLVGFDLVGFGSGVFNMALHPRLRAFADALPREQRGNAFVFNTSGFPEPRFRRYLRSFTRQLETKGFDVVDTFSCRGFDTWFPLKVVGGIRKGHPDAPDLDAARTFAQSLRSRIGATS